MWLVSSACQTWLGRVRVCSLPPPSSFHSPSLPLIITRSLDAVSDLEGVENVSLGERTECPWLQHHEWVLLLHSHWTLSDFSWQCLTVGRDFVWMSICALGLRLSCLTLGFSELWLCKLPVCSASWQKTFFETFIFQMLSKYKFVLDWKLDFRHLV